MINGPAQPVLLVVGGRDPFLVAGFVGLVQTYGYEVGTRSDQSIGESSSNRRLGQSATISVVMVSDDEDFARALPTVRTQTPILVISGKKLAAKELATALLANVIGVVDPAGGINQIVRALEQVSTGSTMWSVEHLLLATRYLRESPEGRPQSISLTSREHEVLRLLHHGESIRSVATLLQISPKTVEALQRGLYRKLGVRGKIQAIDVGINAGLLP
jgi:DNA-binding NarL/FixJ family response regulator